MIAAIILAAILPANEAAIAREVAAEYRLDAEQTALLCAIRRCENGLAGLEFGVGGPMDSGHPAHRFALGQTDRSMFNAESFRCQARWAAGTIRRRYRGEIEPFARVYCPANWRRWTDRVRRFMREQGFTR